MFTAEKILGEYFDMTSDCVPGAQHFVDASDGNEWGVDILVLDEVRDTYSTVAYRMSNPMHDEGWENGSLHDVADAANQAAYDWNQFRNG